MTIRLKTWQTLALFLPSILGGIVISLPHSSFRLYEMRFAIANLLLLFNVTIVVNYQAYLALGFNRKSPMESQLFKWNALIPPVFFTLYLVYVIYSTFNRSTILHSKNIPGPMQKADFNWSSWILMVLIVHTFVTFYFINNQFMSKKIKLISDIEEQHLLQSDFLIPMRRLARISLWVVVISFLLLIVTEFIVQLVNQEL